jgi:hypothetical protein
MKARLVVGCLLAVSALLAGCQSDIEGMPVTSPDSPTEPSFPTSRPSRPTAAPPPATRTPPGTSRAPGGEQLEPENGNVFIETKSGKTRCQISTDEVGCESQFSNAPAVDGMPANGVRLTASGDLEWVVGNLGAIPARTLDYRTYHALGWTIEAGSSGTRFTNDRSGHGMVVAVEGVQEF